jgi:hypothetical protein
MPRNTNTQYYANKGPSHGVSPVRNAVEQPRPGLNEQYAHEYRSMSPVQERKKSVPDVRANFTNAQGSQGSWQNTPYKM